MKIKTVRGIRETVILLAALATLTVPTIIHAGNLEPSAPPAPTMRTLEELKPAWDRIIPASQRFVDALDGNAVLDKETGLVWAEAPDSTLRTWQDAMDYCPSLVLGGRLGWRLPTIDELGSLVDPAASGSPKLPGGHPFQNVQADAYWSSTTNSGNINNAWTMGMDSGSPVSDVKTNSYYVWPVRAAK